MLHEDSQRLTFLERTVEAICKNDARVQEIINQMQADKRMESLIKIYAESLNLGNSYNTVITSVGYAALFTAWVNLKDKINPKASLWIGGLALASVLIFVAWEMTSMGVRNSAYNEFNRMLSKSNNDFDKAFRLFENALKVRQARYMRAHPWVFWPATVIGFSAGITLLIAIIMRLH